MALAKIPRYIPTNNHSQLTQSRSNRLLSWKQSDERAPEK